MRTVINVSAFILAVAAVALLAVSLSLNHHSLRQYPAGQELVQVPGQRAVFLWNGRQLWHVPNPKVLDFLRDSGLPAQMLIPETELAGLGTMVKG